MRRSWAKAVASVPAEMAAAAGMLAELEAAAGVPAKLAAVMRG